MFPLTVSLCMSYVVAATGCLCLGLLSQNTGRETRNNNKAVDLVRANKRNNLFTLVKLKILLLLLLMSQNSNTKFFKVQVKLKTKSYNC